MARTLSIDAHVYHADAIERRELVHIAPSLEITHVVNRVRTQIPDTEIHDIDLGDLPNDEATVLLLNVSEGSLNLTLTDSSAQSVTFTSPKMLVMLNTSLSAISLTGTSDDPVTVYDLIIGAKSS